MEERSLMESAGRSLQSALVIAAILSLVLLAIDTGPARPGTERVRRGALRLRTISAQEQQSHEFVPPVWVIRPRSHDFDRSAEPPVRNPDIKPMVLKSVAPEYPDEARHARIRGIVVVEVLVETDGTISYGRVLKALPFGLTKAAIESLREWRFEPGLVDNKPVRSVTVVAVTFAPPPEK